MKRLKQSAVPRVRLHLSKQQGHKCPLCKGSISPSAKKDGVLDHDHTAGHIRDVLCRNCNGIEGKIFNLVRRAKGSMTPLEYLERLGTYWLRHVTSQHGGWLHPTFKTEVEKKQLKAKRQRLKRRKLREERSR